MRMRSVAITTFTADKNVGGPRGSTTIMSEVSSFDGDCRKPKGAILFTGPDGSRDHQVLVKGGPYIGHTEPSPEATGDVSYLCRAAEGCPHPPSRGALVGEVGWGLGQLTDYSLLKTGNQIQLKTFRQANEDRYTHRYQTPFYPPPIKGTQEKQKTAAAREIEGNSSSNASTNSIIPQEN